MLVVFTLRIEVSEDARMPIRDRTDPSEKWSDLGMDSDEHHEVRINARI